MIKSFIAVAGAGLVLSLAAPAGASHGSWSEPGRVLGVQPAEQVADYPSGTLALRVEYGSTDPQHRPILASGLVLVPPGRRPAGGWPVVAWDHGTIGIGDSCAPSVTPDALYSPTLGALLHHGYAVAAADYPGLGTPGVHPYLIAESEARATIDMVRAARNLVPGLSRTWAAVGHSQGGQAAWATDEVTASYGAGLDFRGSVALAPAPNMSPFVDYVASANPQQQAFFAMMLVGLATQHPELTYADYLRPAALAQLPAVRTECIDDLIARFAAAHLPATDFGPTDPAARDQLQRWFAADEIGHVATTEPLLVLQGEADEVVPPPATTQEVAMAQANGTDVTYRTYPGVDHFGLPAAAQPAVLDWLGSHT